MKFVRNRGLSRIMAIILIFSMMAGFIPATPAAAAGTPKNVILLIGDGMGFEHIEAARAARATVGGHVYTGDGTATVGGRVYMDDVNDAFGRMTTHSADAAITDSSSAATAMASGYKINNNVLGLLPDGLTSVPTVLELAEDKGLATGLVTTTQIAHATPAGFASHVKHRNMFNTITTQYFDNFAAKGKPIEVLMGGGRDNFDNRPAYTGGVNYGDMTDDGRNLIDEFTAQGYQFAGTAAELAGVNGDRVLGLFEPKNGLTQELNRQPGNTEPHLYEMTGKALEVLAKDPDGFFLMVEGGQIDWASHANDLDNTVGETLAFDDAVKVALDFQAANPDTLVIVTADHETGGLSFDNGSATWSSTDHTAALVPVMAEGPGAELFSGTMDNTDLPRKIAQLINLDKPLVLHQTGATAGVPVAFTVTSLGLPVTGAKVTVKQGVNNTLATITTDADGKAGYTFAAVGGYSVFASKDGYLGSNTLTLNAGEATAGATINDLSVLDGNFQPVVGELQLGKQYYLNWKARKNAEGGMSGLAIVEVLNGAQPVFLNAANNLEVKGDQDKEFSVLFQPTVKGSLTIKGFYWNGWSNSASWQSLAAPLEKVVNVN